MARLNEMIFIRNEQTQRWLDVTGDDVCQWADTVKKRGTVGSVTVFWSTLEKLLLAGFCLLLAVGCSSTVSPEIADRAAELSSSAGMEKAIDTHARAMATALAAQKLTGEMTLKNTQAIIAKLNTLEASLVKSASQQAGGDPKESQEPPAKANTTPDPLKVATPGASQETLVELATRLYSQGVNTNMKTREELEAIDAQMQGVKSQPVQYQMRASLMKPAATVCVNGQCFTPQVSRRIRR